MFLGKNHQLILMFFYLFFVFGASLSCRRDFSAIIHPPDSADTTSHEFLWDYTIIESPYGGGLLYDVAIVNENDIWAVGEIYADSSIGANRFNAVHWNGQAWILKRVPYNHQGQFYYHPLKFIFIFNNSSIIYGGNGIIYWDGQNYQPIEIPSSVWYQVSINKIWGGSKDDYFIIGDNGSIARYKNTFWQKLESGTTLDIWDIWGAINSTTGEEEILAVASHGPISPLEKRILKIKDMTVTTLPDSGLADVLSGIWLFPGWRYYAVGSGVFYTTRLGDSWIRDMSMPSVYTYAMRGNNWNDVFIVGSYGLIMHYNGSSWRQYGEGEVPSFYGIYNSVAVKDDLVVAVGDINAEKGIILVGRRLN